MAPAAAIRNSSLLVGLIAVLCAAVLAFFIARSLTRPIRQLTAAVEAAGHSGAATISGRRGRRDRGIGARLRPRDGRSRCKGRGAGTRSRGPSPHRSRARPFRRARAPVRRRRRKSSNDAIVTKTLEGTITGWNPAAERLFGFAAAEAVGKNIDIIVPSDRTPEVQDILRRIGWGETIEHYETNSAAQGWPAAGGFAQHIPDQVPVRGDHRRLEDRARHHRKQANPARAPPADRGTPPHLRNLPGPDRGYGSPGYRDSGESKLRNHPGICSRRK